MKTETIWSRVSPEIRKMMRRLAESQGLSVSEYVRQLIIKDLDRRSVFTSQLKQNVEDVDGT